jgi:FkbM family methyltransferase
VQVGLKSIPFKRTLDDAGEKGLSKTISTMIGLALKEFFLKVKFVPEMAVISVGGGYRMLVFPREEGIHKELFYYRKREPLSTNFLQYSGVLKQGDVVLDVGANIGYYALLESKLVGETGRVYAVEPVISNFKLLEKNVQLNNARNIQAFQFAFGAEKAETEIYISTTCNWCTLDKEAVQDYAGSQKVSVATVDSFLEDKATPKLIRMDVEGYEYDIFQGMPKTLEKDVTLFMEVHPTLMKSVDGFFEILKRNGYFARFAVFEEKVALGKVTDKLMKKGGAVFPLYFTNINLDYLRKLMNELPLCAPRVFFQKQAK